MTKLGPDQSAPKADVMGRMGGDEFLRGVHACDEFLHLLFFLRENHGDGFFRPSFLVTDSSWRTSMPQTYIWACLVHKITMGQITGSNLL